MKPTANLGYFDTVLALTHALNAQDRHASVLALTGNLNIERFKNALQKYFNTYPNLQARLKSTAEGFSLIYDVSFDEVAIEEMDIDTEEKWRAILQTKLHTQFIEGKPLWEVNIIKVKGSNHHILLQHFHHSMCDGTSTSVSWPTIFNYYYDESLPVQKRATPQLAASMFKDSLSWNSFKESKAAADKSSQSSCCDYEQDAKLEDRKTEAVLFAFNIRPLNAYCKQHNITINQLLMAACILAETKNSKQPNTSILTCINLRKWLSDASVDASDLAAFFNIVVMPFETDPKAHLLVVACEYQRVLDKYKHLAYPPLDFNFNEIREGLW